MNSKHSQRFFLVFHSVFFFISFLILKFNASKFGIRFSKQFRYLCNGKRDDSSVHALVVESEKTKAYRGPSLEKEKTRRKKTAFIWLTQFRNCHKSHDLHVGLITKWLRHFNFVITFLVSPINDFFLFLSCCLQSGRSFSCAVVDWQACRQVNSIQSPNIYLLFGIGEKIVRENCQLPH